MGPSGMGPGTGIGDQLYLCGQVGVMEGTDATGICPSWSGGYGRRSYNQKNQVNALMFARVKLQSNSQWTAELQCLTRALPRRCLVEVQAILKFMPPSINISILCIREWLGVVQ